MISFSLFLTILTVHWLADFTLQTHEQAINKSSSNKWLAYHVSTYSIVWLFVSWAFFSSFMLGFLFAVITWVCHYVTDYSTSRISKPFWTNNDAHNGFVVIGFDQILHYLQLYGTFKLIEMLLITLNA